MAKQIKIFQSTDYDKIQNECNDFMFNKLVLNITHDIRLRDVPTPLGSCKEIEHIIVVLYEV